MPKNANVICESSLTNKSLLLKQNVCMFIKWSSRGVFSTGAMGALAPAILNNKLLAPAIFGHFGTVGKKLRMLSNNLINTQGPQY